MARLNVYVYPGGAAFGDACEAMIRRRGHTVSIDLARSDLAIAPLLRRRVSHEDLRTPRHGTLIFHPSALPYGRGPDAIRWSVHRGERVSAATWFWADDGLDTGPICAQRVVVLKPGESAGRAYHTRFVPAALAALESALAGVESGVPVRVPQDEELASYDTFASAEVSASAPDAE